MNYLTSIIIENFRSINHLELNKLNQFNLIIGKNNSGKSTILESIYFGLGLPRLMYFSQINELRHLVFQAPNDISSAFYKMDTTKPIQFDVHKGKKNRKITISLNDNTVPLSGTTDILKTNKTISDVKIEVKTLDEKQYSVNYKYEQANSTTNHIVDNPEYLNSEPVPGIFFWTTDFFNYNYSAALSNLIVNKKKDFLIKALQAIDKNVKDIQLGANGMIFIDIGLSSLLPLKLLGQGIEKILAIITIISTLKNGVFIIDEFENGLHFTSMDKLWTILFEVCSEQNIQLFATTHSYECIESFISKSNEDVSIFRIETGKDEKINAINISKDVAREAVEQRWELR